MFTLTHNYNGLIYQMNTKEIKPNICEVTITSLDSPGESCEVLVERTSECFHTLYFEDNQLGEMEEIENGTYMVYGGDFIDNNPLAVIANICDNRLF